MTAIATTALHPFEEAGLGRAPFRFIDLIDHGSPKANCQFCGKSIRYEARIESVDRRESGVGCDCVRKLGHADNRLLSTVERAMATIETDRRNAAREARRQERIARHAAAMDAQRARNGGLTDDELADKRRRDELAARRAEATAANGWILSALGPANGIGGFIDDMRTKLAIEPISSLSDRQLSILADIYGSRVGGRRGSKAYEAAVDQFWAQIK